MQTLLRTLFFLLLLYQICFAQWYEQYSGTTKNLHDVVFLNANTGIAVGDSGLILRTTNDGLNWVLQPSGTSNNLNDVFFNNSNTGYAVGDSNTILKTTDGGISWLQQSSDTSAFWNSVHFIDDNNGWACGANYDGFSFKPVLIKTSDGGINWIPQPTSIGSCVLSCIDFINESVGWVIYVWYHQDDGPSSYIYKTTDGGLTWNLKFIYEGYLTLNKVKFNNQNYGIAVGGGHRAFGGHIYRTTDGGETWDEKVFPELYTFRNVFLIDETRFIVVGDDGGIYYTTDSGENWVQQYTGTNISFKGVYFVNELIGWVVGDNGTILHTTNGGISFIDNEPTQPTEFILEQNFPNPFNPNTKIKYTVPQTSQVAIKVFDILGNEIETLVNEEKLSGTYEINWYTAGLPSGVYYYQLRSGEIIQTRKMLLLK